MYKEYYIGYETEMYVCMYACVYIHMLGFFTGLAFLILPAIIIICVKLTVEVL